MGNKRIISILPLLSLIMITSCGSLNKELSNTKLRNDDNYRNYYQIFPISYCDSNGDGYGDLNGITNKLDYIQDLGYNGIWLTPIHETNSYHGYDVIDYKSINPCLGTMDDYKNLINECHKRSIKIILDLVLNHSSRNNEWFIKGSEEFKSGKKEKYYDYYNFSLKYDDYHTKYYNGVYYEALFDDMMPDLNLDNPDVRNEIKDIIKFYLDMGVDGFRLDACTHFYSGSQDKNIEFLSFVNNETKKINKNAYIVGEAWTSAGEITNLYKSGVDSFFAYNSNPLGTNLMSYIVTNDAGSYNEKVKFLISQAGQNIPAPFITNHDNPRAANMLQGTKKNDNLKFGYGIMAMMSGTIFNYYGDEIGMVGKNPPDQNVRTAMLRGDKNIETINPPGTTETKNVYGTVADQLEDKSSLLNYFKKTNLIRNKFDSIRKGNVEIIETQDEYVSCLKKTFGEETTYVLSNFGDLETKINLNDISFKKYDFVSLEVEGAKVSIENEVITLPHHSIAVIYE